MTMATVAKTRTGRYSALSWPYCTVSGRSVEWIGRALSRKKEFHEMPQKAWSPKRERQYEHIKEGLLERGSSEDKAEEIAARTVNKERAQHGETKEAAKQ